jgi:hypothetical protein
MLGSLENGERHIPIGQLDQDLRQMFRVWQ